jgi:hypothetical protein
LVDPKVKRNAEAAFKAQQASKSRGDQPSTGYLQAPTDGALDDRTLAANMLAQAERMHTEANSMIGEAARMRKEAERMYPGVMTKDQSPKAESAPAKRTRTRTAKPQPANVPQ